MILDLSSLYFILVKLLLYWNTKLDISWKIGWWFLYTNYRGFVKLKKVKFLTVTVLVFPGFCPQSSTFSGANTTPSKTTESIILSKKIAENIMRIKKIPMQTTPQILFFSIELTNKNRFIIIQSNDSIIISWIYKTNIVLIYTFEINVEVLKEIINFIEIAFKW